MPRNPIELGMDSITYFLLILLFLGMIDGYQPSLKQSSLVQGLREIESHFDGFIVDQWGVLHDGKRPYDGTVECLQNLRNKAKKVVLLSNSSKRKEKVYRSLEKIGFPRNLFDDCITSGEVGWNMIASNSIAGLDLGKYQQKNVFIIGNGEDDEEYVQTAGCRVSDLDNAHFMIARGTFSVVFDETRKESFASPHKLIEMVSDVILPKALSKNLLLFITNPDIMRPGCNSPMPGQIGERYAAMGGRVVYVGKPHSKVYEECFNAINAATSGSPIPKNRICGVGDSLHHDIKGAQSVDIGSIWTANGVHCRDIGMPEGSSEMAPSHVLEEFLLKTGIMPDYTTPSFRW